MQTETFTEFEYWRSEMHNSYGPNRRDWPAWARELEGQLTRDLLHERQRAQEPAR